MQRSTRVKVLVAFGALSILAGTSPALAATPDARVSSGSPAGTFPQNKQNEPSVARDPISGTLIAGSNDEIDLAPCTQSSTGAGRCPFTPNVGVSGVYFSTDNGSTWVQPTYSGYSARSGTGTYPGPIGTLPNYPEAGLVSNGDPGVAVGPAPDAAGHFSWSNGSRFYYSNLAGNFSGSTTLASPYFAVAVSYTDNVAGAVAGSNAAWSAPVIASGRMNHVLFNDKNAMWVDNAASSPYFGRAYVSWTAFRAASNTHTPAEPEPIMTAHSDDGGRTWSQPLQISPAADNAHNGGRQGSTVRSDSHGNVYVFWEGSTKVGSQNHSAQEYAVSHNGGATYSAPIVAALVTDVGTLDAFQGRYVFDGYAGARTDSFPSVDIANGAPSGAGASDRILLGWSDGSRGFGSEDALLQSSTDGGNHWSKPRAVQTAGDRPNFTAVAISPDGKTAYTVYNAFHATYADNNSPRPMEGVVLALNGDLSGAVSEIHRGASGDARASSANSLTAEFLGDYNQAVASNSGVTPVWNDVRGADNCNAVDAYRAAIRGGTFTASSAADFGEDSPASASVDTTPAKPYPPVACGATSRFGNTDIFGGTYSR